MIYVCSDIHGCYDRYQALLKRLRLGREDTLYLLGDLIDRGPEGLRVLRDAVSQSNVIPLLGNHELAAALCLPWLTREITAEALADEQMLARHMEDLTAWRNDGGDATLEEFSRLDRETRQEVIDALLDLEVFAETEAGGRSYVLVHGGLDNFSPDRPLEDYGLDELLLHRPDPEKIYFEDRYLVFGHTPTRLLSGRDEIWKKGMLIDVDCGCVFGGRLGCLCLDTLEEIYV